MFTNVEDKAINIGHEAITDMFHHFLGSFFFNCVCMCGDMNVSTGAYGGKMYQISPKLE